MPRIREDSSDDDEEESSEASEASESEEADSEEEAEGVDVPEDQEVVEKTKAEAYKANVASLQNGSVVVRRAPLVPGILSTDPIAMLKRPFKVPSTLLSGDGGEELRRRTASRIFFVPWGKSISDVPRPVFTASASAPELTEDELPPGVEPLVLWEPPDDSDPKLKPVVVDNMLAKWLRPHQREGVQFMFECVLGLRGFDGCGCILADDMGLGKTLQSIALLWTLLKQSPTGEPAAKRVMIVCPTSLVSNWDSECEKWLKGRVRTMPLAETSRQEVISSVRMFLSPRCPAQVLILSYETFRIHSALLTKPGACDLLICDEAHRLKNDETLTNRALDALECKRRILLSGTPIQNKLDEFYAMVSFANPGILGTGNEFHKKRAEAPPIPDLLLPRSGVYENPILNGREPDASDAERSRGQERSSELSKIVDGFILRRTNALLSAHLPPKVIEIVMCKMTPLQEVLYSHFISSKAAKAALSGKQTKVLGAILALKKLCNHPRLIYDMYLKGKAEQAADGFEGCQQYFTPGIFDDGRLGRGQAQPGWEMYGGKFAVLADLLHYLRTQTKDRIVLVSNYTQTLDLLAQLCRERKYPYCRLDGSLSIPKRQQLVRVFNDPAENQFAFLLSSKAGGCGLNLIGGNRLVLFDPDWNPANDKQAAGRVWRDGQTKRVFVYRFLTAGTIEEKVYQRQLNKEGLQGMIDSKGKMDTTTLSRNELRKLFELRQTPSDTHDTLPCKRCPKPAAPLALPAPGEEGAEGGAASPPPCAAKGGPLAFKAPRMAPKKEPAAESAAVAPAVPPWEAQVGKPAEEDLANWAHHLTMENLPDEAMRVSFIFSCKIEGKDIPGEGVGSGLVTGACAGAGAGASGSGSGAGAGAGAGASGSGGAGASGSGGAARAVPLQGVKRTPLAPVPAEPAAHPNVMRPSQSCGTLAPAKAGARSPAPERGGGAGASASDDASPASPDAKRAKVEAGAAGGGAGAKAAWKPPQVKPGAGAGAGAAAAAGAAGGAAKKPPAGAGALKPGAKGAAAAAPAAGKGMAAAAPAAAPAKKKGKPVPMSSDEESDESEDLGDEDSEPEAAESEEDSDFQ